jgi:hypothetical protein
LVDTEIEHNYFSVTEHMELILMPFITEETAPLSVPREAMANAQDSVFSKS